MLTGTKLSFSMNPVSVCEIMIAAFVSDAMLVKAAFQSALSNDTVVKQFGIMVWAEIPYHGRSNFATN